MKCQELISLLDAEHIETKALHQNTARWYRIWSKQLMPTTRSVIVILTAYFDESGTHGGSALSVMAGFIGDARQWRKFKKRTSKLFTRFGVDIFHTIDLKRTDKDFEGWKVDRKIEFLDEFQHVINETLERGFASILRQADYDYYRNLYWPPKARKDSQYGLLCRASMSSAVDSALAVPRWRDGAEPRLKIVLESGHKNAPDAVRLYDFFRDRFKGQSKALSELMFDSKESCLPLAAADLFAYSAYGNEVGARPLGTPRKPIKSEASYRGNLYRIVLERETLDALHEQACSISNRSF
jgi:hypothetical protein